MLLTQSALKEKSAELVAGIADARSARNLMTRRRREDAADEREAERHRRRRKRKDDRELEQLLRRRARVRVPLDERPRIGVATARKLYHRTVGMLRGTTGITDARGPDGLYSLHFGFVARGFASTTGRRWRAGEAERAARYIVREDGLEGGELGWWSNIAADRTELVAFFRAVEAVERHDRSNANVYVSEIIALPAELSARQRRRAVKRICRFLEKRGLAYVAAIHIPDEVGDQRNFHCHIIYSLRPAERHGAYDWSFGLAKETDINTPEGIAARRRQVVRDINATLHAAGIDKRYTHLSNKARRMAAAQAKVGQNVIWVSRRLAALETRAARLREIADIARRVRETLSKSNAALARMKAAIEDRLAEKRKELEASMKMASAQGAALRTIVIDQLERQRSTIAVTRTDAQRELDRCATHIAKTVDRYRRDMDQAQRAVAAQVTVMADRIRNRIDERRAEIGASQPERACLLDGARTDLRRALETRRAAVVAGIADARASLDRAGKRIELLEKRRAFDAIQAKVAVHRAELASAIERLPAKRAEARLWAAAAHPLSHRIAGAREILVRDLIHRKGQIVASREAAEKELAEAKAAGRKLVSRGIGHGPGANQTPCRGATSAPTSGIAEARSGSQIAVPETNSLPSPKPAVTPQASVGSGDSTGSSIAQPVIGMAPAGTAGAPSNSQPAAATEAWIPASKKRGKDQESLRRHVRERTPARTTDMAPPPLTARPPPDPEALRLLAARMLAMRDHVRAREERVRRKLRQRTLRYLARLDHGIVVDESGRYGVAKGVLTDDEVRVLMDPGLDKETQATLGRIATARTQEDAAQSGIARSQASVPPLGAPAMGQPVSSADEDFQWLQRQRAHQQGGGGIGGT
ncbi:MobA/MobL family protein [Sphingomonas sp. ID1715]|uniref:MobA/MobL family protein n=1 Tax=Sphingomonas sp. ID1715 TaxID=1656898 RepID=UPI001488F932|nr:MobA/MobL family protein [Sphingomonas sp. ID1715]NNM76509.1 MobA/MobL family protein [Sphingomonas sp. ID1715]